MSRSNFNVACLVFVLLSRFAMSVSLRATKASARGQETRQSEADKTKRRQTRQSEADKTKRRQTRQSEALASEASAKNIYIYKH
jgi:hypothetical protein